MRQVAVYFPFENEIGKAAPPIDVEQKPDRVWTLLHGHQKPDDPPELPFAPSHHYNAFLEDYVHDWDWRNGKFYYRSRVTKGKVWLLLEYKDDDR